MLPLVINMESKKVAIFGGGSVAERKAKLFSEYSPTVIISKNFMGGIRDLARDGGIRIEECDISDENIERFVNDAFIVIPATDDRVLNDKIAKVAESHHKLVNRVDGKGDVIVPSVIKKGDIRIGISTSGKSPGMSRFLREKMEMHIGKKDAEMVRLQYEIRELLKRKVRDQSVRQKILRDILYSDDVWNELSNGYEKAYELAMRYIKEGLYQHAPI
jgi:precorrin-2 dehydrogenase/sirohydrochlorin ferrochelatase